MAERIFLGSNEPLACAAAKKLAEYASSTIPDIGNILLVLPGKLAGKNIQSSLLDLFPEGILLPQILSPHALLHYQCDTENYPTPPADDILWGLAVAEAVSDREKFPLIFRGKNTPPDNFSAAETFRQLREELLRGGYSISEAADKLGAVGSELAALEKIYLDKLKNAGYKDRIESDRLAAENISGFSTVRKIIIAGMPDLPGILISKLKNIDAAYPGIIEIWIGADENDAAMFDQWGIPDSAKWLEKSFLCNDKISLHTALNAADAARHAMHIASNGSGIFDADECSIILADPELYSAFAVEFSGLNSTGGKAVTVVDPAGVPLASLRICTLLDKLHAFLEDPSDFAAAAELFANRDFLLSCCPDRNRSSWLLEQLDDFRQKFYPDNTFDAADIIRSREDFKGLHLALENLLQTAEDFKNMPLTGFLQKFFTSVYRNASDIDTESVSGVPFYKECDLFRNQLREFESLPKEISVNTDNIRLLEVFLKNCRNIRAAISASPEAIAFEGRLEMPFVISKKLIFCGMNDKYFPDRINPTPFLNDSIRQEIGIRSSRETFVRSLYHLECAAKARKDEDFHIIVLRQDSEGSMLKPSELLFAGSKISDKTLLARCEQLFRDPVPLRIHKEHHGLYRFKFSPQLDFKRDAESGLMQLSPTDLDAYITSPYTFFMQKVKRINDIDYEAAEPDTAQSGSLCHKAIELLGTEKFSSAEKIKTALFNNFDRMLNEKFGRLPALLHIFSFNMKQRFEYAAEKLFEEQQQGFDVVAVEYKFGGGKGIIYANALFHGTIDRIEYDRSRNIIRIVDIKSGRGSDVETAHCTINKNGVTFKKLQLILYTILLQRDEFFKKEYCPELDQCTIECAYFNIPSNVTGITFNVWESEKLSRVIAPAEDKIHALISEISKLPEQMIFQDPDKVRDPLLIPGAKEAVCSVNWQTAGKQDDAEELPIPAQSPQPEKKVNIPIAVQKSFHNESRCCDCPEHIRHSCSCRGGNKADCQAFCGFKSFNIITASAGTGKTYSLASRFVQLLDFGAEPENILAVTFTRKAAAEIFDRIIKRMLAMCTETHKKENCCRRFEPGRLPILLRKMLVNNGKNARIGTIDSFFMQLIQAYAPELGIWGKISMIDKKDNRMQRKMVRKWIRSMNSEKELDTLRELIKDADDGGSISCLPAINKLTDSVYSFFLKELSVTADGRFPQLEESPWIPSEKDVFTPDECTAVISKLYQFAETCVIGNYRKSRMALSAQLKKTAAVLEGNLRGILYGKLDEAAVNLFKIICEKNPEEWFDKFGEILKYSYNIEINAPESDIIRKCFKHFRVLTYMQIRNKNKAVFAIMSKFNDVYSGKIRQAGNLTFDDLPYLLHNIDPETQESMLGNGDLAMEKRLDSQICHYLFDEFQDTSDLQFMIFEPLLRELFSKADDDIFRTFFCVGDIKQSIYQWRGGNPQLFHFLVSNLKPLAKLRGYDPCDSLTHSYRSSQTILDTVNCVFENIPPADQNNGDLAAAMKMMNYERHTAAKSDLSGHAAVLEVTQYPGKGQNIPAKAKIIADIVNKIDPFARNLTVAVLVQENKTVKAFAKELQMISDLPVSVEGSISPVNCMAYNVFKQLLILAAHPGDVQSEYFLNNVCFHPENTPCTNRGIKNIMTMLELPADTAPDEVLRKEISINGIAGFAERFFRTFGNKCSEEEKIQMKILCRCADDFTGSIDEFLRFAENAGESGSALSKTIQIMTYHKSKGMEFDVVFMPDMGKQQGNHSSLNPESQCVDIQTGYGKKLESPHWISYMPASIFSNTMPEIRRNNEKKNINKIFADLCKFYVAMTRAKRALYMLISTNSTNTFGIDKFLKSQLHAYGYNPSDLDDEYFLGDMKKIAALRFSHGNCRWYTGESRKDDSVSYIDITEPRIKITEVKKELASDHGNSVPKPFTGKAVDRFELYRGTTIGTEVHNLFEKTDFIDAAFDAEKFCMANPVSPAARNIFCDALQANSPLRAALAEPSGEYELWKEKSFIVRNNAGAVVPGIFDRVVLYKENGKVTCADIIDFKSDDLTLPEEYFHYFPQLEIYRQALTKLLGISSCKIRCFIYALRIKTVIEVPHS